MLEWYGEELETKYEERVKKAMDSVMVDCVRNGKRLVHVKTATLQGSIEMRDTKKFGNELIGYWGSFDVNYAIYQELPIFKGSKPYLRPSMDKYYPELAGRIAG